MTPIHYDALIIGAGPAGLAAATALGRACRQVAVFDSQEYRNEGAQEMHNVVLHDGQNPALYRASAIEHISSTYKTVRFTDTEITSARTFPILKQIQGFEVTDYRGNTYRGQKLILATGSKDVLPDIPGYAELWGDGIVHCLFCDLYEQRGRPGGVLGLKSLQDIAPTLMACHLSDGPLTIFLNGETPTSDQERLSLRVAVACGCKIDTRTIRCLSRSVDGVRITFDDASQDIGFLMHSPPTVNRAVSLISSLGLDTAGESLHIQSKNSVGETNVRGCSAAGDTATASKVVSVALATGTMAGIGASRQLAIDEGCQAVHETEGTASL